MNLIMLASYILLNMPQTSEVVQRYQLEARNEHFCRIELEQEKFEPDHHKIKLGISRPPSKGETSRMTLIDGLIAWGTESDSAANRQLKKFDIFLNDQPINFSRS